MDPKFPDRMAELGEVSSEILNSRWATVVSVASAAGSHQKARLVLLACRGTLDRDADEWFWSPFRATDDTFRVDDAVETHARLAEAAARHLISTGDNLTPMLVRLALLSGRVPVSPDLAEDAEPALREATAEIPGFVEPKGYWAKAQQEPVRVEGGADPVTLSKAVDRIALSSQSAIAELAQQVVALTEWAEDAERRFGIEQQLVQWLLGGVRGDGTAWPDLSPAAMAIDAAWEMSRYVLRAPQPRHEAILAQVLAVSGVDEKAIKPSAEGVQTTFESTDDRALAELSPITFALATGKQLERESPYQLARRVLWEATTAEHWDTE